MNTPVDITNVILTTQRLTLRPWRETDIDDFFEYASVDGVGQMAGWTPHKSMDESRVILGHFISNKWTFAIEYEGKVIGSLGVEEYEEDEFPEFADKQARSIGYVLSKDYWGRGLMPEAVKRVLKWLFDEVDLDFVTIGHFEWNSQSRRVIEKCGGKPYKTIRFETRYGTVENSIENIIYNPNRA